MSKQEKMCSIIGCSFLLQCCLFAFIFFSKIKIYNYMITNMAGLFLSAILYFLVLKLSFNKNASINSVSVSKVERFISLCLCAVAAFGLPLSFRKIYFLGAYGSVSEQYQYLPVVTLLVAVCFDFLVTFLLVSYSLDKYQKSLSTANMSDFVYVLSPGDKGLLLIGQFCENICVALIIYLAVLTLILVISIPTCLLKYIGLGGLKALLLYIVKSHSIVLLVAAGFFLVTVVFRLAFNDYDIFYMNDNIDTWSYLSCILMVPISWCCYGYLPVAYERILAHYNIIDNIFCAFMEAGIFLFIILICFLFLLFGNFIGIFSLAVSDAIKEKIFKKPVQSKQS